MASKWIHKEAWWQHDGHQVAVQNAGFIEWLNEQCEDGWEVLKISRVFSGVHRNTWVVFRKQV